MVDADRHIGLGTCDPKRDTPKRLGHYLPFVVVEFIGVSGDSAQTEVILQRYAISINRVALPGSATGYLLDQTTLIYGIDAA